MNCNSIMWNIIALCYFYSTILAQMDSGIVNLAPSQGNLSTYTLQNRINGSLVISLSSFTSIQTQTYCETTNLGPTAIIQCTNNIQSFSYLFYISNIMITSSAYTMYFFDKDTREQVNLPIELGNTHIQKPQIRAFIQGYEQLNKLQSYIDIVQSNSSSSLNIKRYLNVRRLKFVYLVIQNSPLYNLSFESKILSSSKKLVVTSKKMMNFLGISRISFARQSYDSLISLQIISSSIINTTSQILNSITSSLSISQIIISQNTQINAILISYNEPTPCNTSQSFSPSLNSCTKTCENRQILQYSFMQKITTFCLNKTLTTSKSSSSSLNNYNTIYNFTPFGCKTPSIKQYSTVICKQCRPSFFMMDNRCLCGYNYYQRDNSCLQCSNYDTDQQIANNCVPALQTQVKALEGNNLDTISIEVLYRISKIDQIVVWKDYLMINITVNSKKYMTQAKYDNHSKIIRIIVQNVQISPEYQVQVIQQKQHDYNISQLLYVLDDNGSYLWFPSLQPTIINHPISNKQIVESIAPIFANTQTSVPIIITVSFAIGQKINLLGIFQTVSVLYLINFINLNQNLKDLGLFIKQMFIFQPAPLIKIFGKDGIIKVDSIDPNMTKINPLIMSYTKGQSYMQLGLNNIIVYSIQVAIMFAIIKIFKFLASPSKNMIIPTNKYIQNGNFKIKRSQIIAKSKRIKWLKQPQLSEQSTIRQKLYYRFYLLDEKKCIIATTLIFVQIVGNSFLILQELTIPAYSVSVIISQIIALVIFLLILLYPVILSNVDHLYILKCVSVIYKRRDYTPAQLWGFFYYYYIECVIFSVIILASQQGQLQTGLISLSLLIKIAVFKAHLKHIEFIKQSLIFLFFFIAFLTFYVPVAWIVNLKSALLIIILCILACQFFKIIRSILIAFLNFFKERSQKKEQSKDDKIIVQVLQNSEKCSKQTKMTQKADLKAE